MLRKRRPWRRYKSTLCSLSKVAPGGGCGAVANHAGRPLPRDYSGGHWLPQGHYAGARHAASSGASSGASHAARIMGPAMRGRPCGRGQRPGLAVGASHAARIMGPAMRPARGAASSGGGQRSRLSRRYRGRSGPPPSCGKPGGCAEPRCVTFLLGIWGLTRIPENRGGFTRYRDDRETVR